MKSKIPLILIIIIIIVCGTSMLKEDVNLDIHGEQITNTSEIYIVVKILDNNGKLIDTNFGKITIEYNESLIEEIPVKHGISIIRQHDDCYKIKVHYDGGYFYNPQEVSQKLIIKNSTDLTDKNISQTF